MDVYIINNRSKESDSYLTSFFKRNLPNCKLEFSNKSILPAEKYHVLIYYGTISNSHYYKSLTQYFAKSKSIIIGFGVDISGDLLHLIREKRFDCFDHIFFQDKFHTEVIQKRIGTLHSHYFKNIETKEECNLPSLENMLKWAVKRKSPNYFDSNLICDMVRLYANNLLKKNILSCTKLDLSALANNEAFKISDMACYQVTGIFGSKYIHKFQAALEDKPYNLVSYISDVISDFDKEIFKPKINIEYVNQEGFNGVHRWGWEGVIRLIKQFTSQNGGLLFDTFMDKTFTWCKSTNVELGLIPYTVPWIGILHHPFDNSYSRDNAEAVLSSSEFKNSLEVCKMIICFSNDLASKVRSYISKYYPEYSNKIQVISLYHPCEIPTAAFSYRRFSIEPNGSRIIQVGSWLRNTFSIYAFNVPKTNGFYTKYALKGLKMDNLYPPDTFVISKKEIEEEKYGCSGNVWVKYCMKYIKSANYLEDILGKVDPDFSITITKDLSYSDKLQDLSYSDKLKSWIIERIQSVKIINKVDNNEYDKLLTSSIVFLDLVDCSASNTIIECIVRRVPVLVNRLPALEEYLGTDYPLFYDNFDHALKLLSKLNLSEIITYLESRFSLVLTDKFSKDFQQYVITPLASKIPD